MKITSKAEMYKLQLRGLLGNFLNTLTWDEFLKFADSTKLYGVRHSKISGSPLFATGLTVNQLTQRVAKFIKLGMVDYPHIVVYPDTTSYDNYRSIQGELRLLPSVPGEPVGLYLRYSGTLANSLTCREEVRVLGGVNLSGMVPQQMVKHFMDANSYDWLQELFLAYPDSTIEFTCFNKSVGAYGWNTLFWEVRNY